MEKSVIIPSDVTFKRLHDTIQMAMDWYILKNEILKTCLKLKKNEESLT
ncbi:MAG: plasmid pRiA4b ORF-3 family protein [Clostridiales bacterium]|nr:plasmid pRiA4b ORF-3 family protein [Clostridiales bacterium]